MNKETANKEESASLIRQIEALPNIEDWERIPSSRRREAVAANPELKELSYTNNTYQLNHGDKLVS